MGLRGGASLMLRIATVMAGNRQQSRFLALVSNYSRLAELTEEAANSQDAGTLQYLKTLDSIESKLNQLQVAFQEFYTSMGLEKLFKGALDSLTGFITTLNSLPKLFNTIPVAAIGMATNLILGIKNILTLLATPIYNELQNVKTAITNVTGSKYEIKFHINKQQVIKDATEAARAAHQAAQQEFNNNTNNVTSEYQYESRKTKHQDLINETNALNAKIKQGMVIAGNLIKLAGATTSAVLLARQSSADNMLKSGRENNKVGSGLAGLAGNVVGGALTGGIPGVVLGIIQSIPNIITLFDGLTVTSKELVAQLDTEIQKQKEQVILRRNEVSTLESAAKKLEELREHQYDSAEANQEYIDYMNQLGESHSELVSSLDAEGNSVIELKDVYTQLINTRAKLSEEELKQRKLELQRETVNSNEISRILGLSARDVAGLVGQGRFGGGTERDKLIGAIAKAEGLSMDKLLSLDVSNLNAISLPRAGLGKVLEGVVYELADSSIWDKVNPGIDSAAVKEKVTKWGRSDDEYTEPYLQELQGYLKNLQLYGEIVTDKTKELAQINEQLSNINNQVNKWAANFRENTALSELSLKNLDAFQTSPIVSLIAQQIEGLKDLDLETDEGQAQATQQLKPLLDEYKSRGTNWEEAYANYYINTLTYTDEVFDQWLETLKNESYGPELQKIFSEKRNAEKQDALTQYVERVADFIGRFETALGFTQGDFSMLADFNTIKEKIAPAHWTQILNNLYEGVGGYIEQGLYQQARNYYDSYIGILSTLNTQGLDTQASQTVLNFLTSSNLTDYDSLTQLISSLETYDQSNEDIDLTDIIQQLTQVKQSLAYNVNTIKEDYLAALTTLVKSADDLAKDVSKGLDYSDLAGALSKIHTLDAGKDLELTDIVQYSQEAGAYIYTTQGFLLAQQQVMEQIQQETQDETARIEARQVQLQAIQAVDLTQFWSSTDTTWTQEQLTAATSSIDDETTRALVQQAIQAGVNDLQSFQTWFAAEIQNNEELLQWLPEQEKLALEQYFSNLRSSLMSAIDWNKLAQGIDTDFSIQQLENIFTTISPDEDVHALAVEFANNIARAGTVAVEAYKDLIAQTGTQFDYDTAKTLFEGQMTHAADALSELYAAQIGDVLSKETNNLLASLGINDFSVDELGVVGGDLTEAADQLYQTVIAAFEAGEATVAQVNAVAQVKLRADREKASDALDIFSKGYDLTEEDLTRYAELIGQPLYQLMGTAIEYIDGLGYTINITEADLDTLGLDRSSKDFIEAWHSRNDKIISAEQEETQKIVDEVNNLTSAKIGDKLNLTYIQSKFGDFGGQIVDGILTITEDTNILQLATSIRAQMEASGQFLQSDIVALGEALDNLLKSYASLISGGIQGSLSQTDAANLKGFAKNSLGVDIDFTRTKNGLKLSTDQAGKLYQELKKVDSITAQLVFDDLVESLSEAGSGFENISQTMARIAETQRQIAAAQGDTSGLQEQLALYQEIARAQSDNPDSFSFMDNSIPAGMQGPENYWNAVGTAFKVMNQAGQSGYMEIQDFYNITQEMKNLAIMSGNDLQFMGQTIYADGSGAAELIQMAMSALSNIDGEGVKVDFSKLGQSFSGGAADMASGFDDAVKTMAKAQIEMLDAEIAMLEAIVAMEELGDIDVDQNGILDPSEIFEDDGSYTGDWTQIIDRIRDNFENSETLAPLLENLEISGIKLGDLLDSSNQKWREVGISAEQYSSIMTALYKAAMSGDYDLDAIISSVQDVLSGTGQIFSYKDESGKQIIIDTSGRTYQFDWTSDTTKKRVAEALGKSKASEADIKAAQEAMDRYTSGQELSVEQNAVVQVILGNVKVVKEDGKPTEYSVDGEKYPTMNDALAAVALRNEGYKVKDITVEEGTATITDKFAGIEVTITANADGTLTYTAEGLGSFSSKEEALTAIYESQVPEEKREIETFEDWKVLTNITTQQGVKITNPKQFAQTSDETKSELIEQLKLGNYDSAEEILAVKCGVRVQLTNEEGELNLDNLQKVEEMFNLEDKTINLTVNLSEGTDPVLAELLNAGETPIPRTMEVDVSATGEFTANFVDSLNNLNAENLEIVVTKLAALSSSTRTLQQADFSNIDGLKTQWEAVLTVVQEVSDLIASLTEKTFTVNVETSGVTTPTVPTPTNTGGQTTPIPTGGGGVVGIDASQITVPGPDIKEWTDAATAVSDASVTAASGLTNVATPLEKMPDVSGRIDSLVSAMQKIPTYAASRVAALASSMAAIQNKVVTHTHIVKVHFDVSSSGSVTPTISHGGDLILPEAKGNVALAGGSKRTLVGELGPELVVSRGHYYVVGQNGAEFVDLDKDAIVFNHLQTKKLLGSGRAGRGTAITNERNAVSWATGNTSGPAMASASEALALLKQIRAMWQSLLGASLKDLGGLAGRGGGGGGGGGGNTKFSPQIGTFERWYNLMRQIADLEQKITLEEAKRKNMRNGADYSRSLQKELTMLQTQLADQKELNYLQQDYLKHEIEDFNKTEFTKIFTFTQDGLMQLVDGPGRGLDVLSKLTATDENGRYIRKLDDSAVNQLNYLESVGFDYSAFMIDQETGNKLNPATEEDAAKIVETFWDRLQYYLDNIDGLRDTIADGLVQEQELLTKIAEIQQEYIDNQLKLEQNLVKAIEDRQQAIIDGLTDEKDAIQEATQAYIDGLSDALQHERDMYQKNQTQQETLQLQRQLAILQRSGGSAADIKNLQDQINGRLQDRYFDAQQEQIDAVQAASDREIERLDYQIELMTEALEYQKENGILWNEVYQMLEKWTPEQMVEFYERYTKEYQSKSALDKEQSSQEVLREGQMFTQNRDASAGWAAYSATLPSRNVTAAAGYDMAAIESAYKSAHDTGGAAAAQKAAEVEIDRQKTALQRRSYVESQQASGAYDTDLSTLPGSDASDFESRRVAFGTGKTISIVSDGTAIPLLKQPTGSMKDESLYLSKGTTAFRATAYLNDDPVKWIEGKFTNAQGKEVRGWFNMNAMKSHIDSASIDALKKQLKAFGVKNIGFSTGGLDDFTGLAMLHGTKRRPEAVLNADQTAFLREDLLGKSRDSLMNIVRELQSLYSSTRAASMVAPAGDTYNFENVSLNFEPGTISNDYSARRAGEQVWDELLSMARKSGNVRVSRR